MCNYFHSLTFSRRSARFITCNRNLYVALSRMEIGLKEVKMIHTFSLLLCVLLRWTSSIWAFWQENWLVLYSLFTHLSPTSHWWEVMEVARDHWRWPSLCWMGWDEVVRDARTNYDKKLCSNLMMGFPSGINKLCKLVISRYNWTVVTTLMDGWMISVCVYVKTWEEST